MKHLFFHFNPPLFTISVRSKVLPISFWDPGTGHWNLCGRVCIELMGSSPRMFLLKRILVKALSRKSYDGWHPFGKRLSFFKDTLMQIWKSANIFAFVWKYFTFYLLRYAHVKYVKCLFTNIQKQKSMPAYFLRNLQTSSKITRKFLGVIMRNFI